MYVEFTRANADKSAYKHACIAILSATVTSRRRILSWLPPLSGFLYRNRLYTVESKYSSMEQHPAQSTATTSYF